jgi:hypothetical protein
MAMAALINKAEGVCAVLNSDRVDAVALADG